MNTAAAKTALATFAATLGWSTTVVPARLTALGHTKACARCGGVGRFSYNRQDGDRCYGCNGSGRVLVKLTAALAATVTEQVKAGALDAYLAGVAARVAAKKELAPLVERARVAFRVVSVRYENWSVGRRLGDNLDHPIFRAQEIANGLFFGVRGGRGLSAGVDALGNGEVDAMTARDEITWRLSQLEVLAAEIVALSSVAAA